MFNKEPLWPVNLAKNHLWSYVPKEVLASGHLVFNKAGFFKLLRFILLFHHCLFQSPNTQKILSYFKFSLSLNLPEAIKNCVCVYVFNTSSFIQFMMACRLTTLVFVSSTGTVARFCFK